MFFKKTALTCLLLSSVEMQKRSRTADNIVRYNSAHVLRNSTVILFSRRVFFFRTFIILHILLFKTFQAEIFIILFVS